MTSERQIARVLDVPIDVLGWDDALHRILSWSSGKESRYVCICNVHSVITASKDLEFYNVVENADMATADGAPVAWMMRRMGASNQQRINGPDLMWRYCALAEQQNQTVFLYGGTKETLVLLQDRLFKAFPRLHVAGVMSPPFRQLTDKEESEIIEQINRTAPGVVFVSLGCPKQEFWMARHRGKINSVMIGVGAAFDYHAGTIKRAPLWMQNSGLEWLHRLMSEPRRLWRRYFVTNTLFVLKATRQILLSKFI